jgi:bacteriocin-like protein
MRFDQLVMAITAPKKALRQIVFLSATKSVRRRSSSLDHHGLKERNMKMVTETRELTDDELNLVTGGDFFDGHARTNGDDPFVRVTMLAAKAAFYEGMWYSAGRP